MVTQERLKELLNYNPDTGIFTWLVTRNAYGGGVRPGSIAGDKDSHGYWRIGIDGTRYPLHRLAWLYVRGAMPENHIDHINGDKADNRLCNLRQATRFENLSNRGKNKNNSSGYKGVWFNKKLGKWIAGITHNNKAKHLGVFETPELAYEAYCKKAAELHGEFAKF